MDRKEVAVGRPGAALELTSSSPLATVRASPNVKRSDETCVHDRADSFLITHLVPCGVLINDQLEIIRFRGNVSEYLMLVPGPAAVAPLRRVRPAAVRADLPAPWRNAIRHGSPVNSK